MSTANLLTSHRLCAAHCTRNSLPSRRPLHHRHVSVPRRNASQMPDQRHRHGFHLRRNLTTCSAASIQTEGRSNKIRLIQHKEEAFWFYRFLSIVYDTIVNPGHWTEDMRTDALSVAQLDDPNLKVGAEPVGPSRPSRPIRHHLAQV